MRPTRYMLVAIVLIVTSGCGDGTCIVPPCAAPVAIDLSVSAASAPAGISGLTVTTTVAGNVPQTSSCQIASVTHCYVFGPPNAYQLQLNAPGYMPVNLAVTVTGTVPACGCVIVDTKQLTVVMQPTAT
jgi:hypothetical protein